MANNQSTSISDPLNNQSNSPGIGTLTALALGASTPLLYKAAKHLAPEIVNPLANMAVGAYESSVAPTARRLGNLLSDTNNAFAKRGEQMREFEAAGSPRFGDPKKQRDTALNFANILLERERITEKDLPRYNKALSKAAEDLANLTHVNPTAIFNHGLNAEGLKNIDTHFNSRFQNIDDYFAGKEAGLKLFKTNIPKEMTAFLMARAAKQKAPISANNAEELLYNMFKTAGHEY